MQVAEKPTFDKHAQVMGALELANAARRAGGAVKREVKAGRLTVARALDDPRAGSLQVLDLLIAQRQWGRIRALPLLREHYISETRRVRDLTERQRRLLAEACGS